MGTGFSVAEVICSDKPIGYTGIEVPDVVLIVSQDGYEKVKQRIHEQTLLLADESIEMPEHPRMVIGEFRKVAGRKGAALCALSYWLKQTGLLPTEALIRAAAMHKHAENLLSAIHSADKIAQSKIPFDLER